MRGDSLKKKLTACLLSNERCDNFPKHLGLALVPNKINEQAT